MKRLIAWALGLGVSLHAAGAGYTDEQWALVSRLLGSAHLAVSADDQWRLRVQGTQLLREPNRQAAVGAIALDVGDAVLAMAASQDARRAVVQTRNCIGLVRFDAAGAPQLVWLPLQAAVKATPPDPCPAVGNSEYAVAVAMSPDGRWAAVPLNNEVHLIDVDQGRVLQRWPLGTATVLQLAFVDEGRELLVRAAVLGEAYEGPGVPSQLMLARWDAVRGGLLDFWIERDRGGIGPLTLVSALSSDLGWLWQVEEVPASDSAPVTVVARSMRECGMPRKATAALQVPRTRWLDLAADPRGRWLAVNDYEPSDHAGWWLLSTTDGRQLDGEMRRGAMEAPLRALQPSGDGLQLRGVRAGLPVGGNVDAETWTAFQGGGAPFARAVKGLPRVASAIQTPRTGTCLIGAEGEQRGLAAREVKDSAAPAQRVFELPLEELDAAQLHQGRLTSCLAENGSGYRAQPLWGLDSDGGLWLDAGAQLWRLDPANGRTLSKLPTPRSTQVCSVAIFSTRQFLNWQGDTVTLRPFQAPSADAARRVVVRRPGWVADSAVWMGDGRIAVRWKNPKAAVDAARGAEGQMYVEQGGRYVPHDSPLPGRVTQDGHAYLDVEEDNDAWVPADAGWLSSPQPPRYRWRVGPFGSLQVHQMQTGELALWLGMAAGAPGVTHRAGALGGDLGLASIGEQDVVFNAARRERRLVLPLYAERVAHLPASDLLLVQSQGRLTAYRLAP